jgi:hypothetical protein
MMALSSETAFDVAPAIDAVGTLAPAPVVMLISEGDKLATLDTLKFLLRPKNVVQLRAFCKGSGRQASPTNAILKLLGA